MTRKLDKSFSRGPGGRPSRTGFIGSLRRRVAAGGIAVFILFLACQVGAGVDLSCEPGEVTAFQGGKVVFNFSVTNHMAESIRPGTKHFISYHLYDEAGKLISYDNRRYLLPKVLRRRKTTSFQVPVFFGHGASGKYIVEFDIVKEGAFWGSQKKWRTCKVKLHLKPLVSDEFKRNYMKGFSSTGDTLIDNEQYLLRVTLKNSEIRTGDGEIFGFSAGSTYPQVWIRDTATLMRYAKGFYSLETLSRGVELFFRHQAAEGEIVDWVDVSGRTGKNTVETDQESSLVLAAYEIVVSDSKWLDKQIGGKTVAERLEMALEWVWKTKRSAKDGLIVSGFTADWGDTENTYPDQRATSLSDRSTLVFGIYTQAKYIQAMDCLIRMLKTDPSKRVGRNERIRRWTSRLQGLKRETVKRLYLNDRGYFITHLVAEAGKQDYFKMEKEMLGVGGNAEAMIAGLMDRGKIKRFLGVLEKRRAQYKLRTVSFTLLPPYPEGFFSHHLLKHPWSYQNGGEWDWIGARVVRGLFLNGFPGEGETYLKEIVKKNLANFCIFEWEDRRGTGRGALFYVGAAGVIGDAILTGFKIKV
ncbi:MAG: hypothetical protein GY940_07770 [bacterium]|nr:hypothetical protein [bacterium]